MKRPHILDMDADGWFGTCGAGEGPKPEPFFFAFVSGAEHERHPERTCEACRAAYEGRK